MEIQSISEEMNKEELQEQAAIQAQARRLEMEKEQAAVEEKLNTDVQAFTDPNMGQLVDLLD